MKRAGSKEASSQLQSDLMQKGVSGSYRIIDQNGLFLLPELLKTAYRQLQITYFELTGF